MPNAGQLDPGSPNTAFFLLLFFFPPCFFFELQTPGHWWGSAFLNPLLHGLSLARFSEAAALQAPKASPGLVAILSQAQAPRETPARPNYRPVLGG